ELVLRWIGLAAALAVADARRLRLAQQVLDGARANARLLQLMPARPLAVWANDRIEADEQLVRDLGLERRPSMLAELVADGGGIAAEDFEQLANSIAAARASAEHVSCKVHAKGSGRVFDIRGGPAPPGQP